MTNKKFKMAAMSLALTACVATAPLAANAEAPEETPDAGVSAATEHAETPEAEAPVEEVPVEEETPEENPPVEETPEEEEAPEDEETPEEEEAPEEKEETPEEKKETPEEQAPAENAVVEKEAPVEVAPAPAEADADILTEDPDADIAAEDPDAGIATMDGMENAVSDEHEAKIGDTSYGTLDEALKQAQAKDEVVLQKDHKGNIKITEWIKLNLNGKKIEGNVDVDLSKKQDDETDAEKKVEIVDGTITGATESGVTIKDAGDTSILLKDLTIEKNEGKQGGGVHIENSQNVTIDHCTIQNNKTTEVSPNTSASVDIGAGGGVFVSDKSHVTIQNGSTIQGNTGTRGGGIYVENSTVEVKNSMIDGNTADDVPEKAPNSNKGLGGGIYSYESTLTVTDSTISGNEAKGSTSLIWYNSKDEISSEALGNGGGGICAVGKKSDVTLDGVTVTGNKATYSKKGTGAGIEAQGGSLTVKDSTISNNEAQGNGGGIFSAEGNVLDVSGSTIQGNKADNGGGIHMGEARDTSKTPSKATITDTKILENEAIGSGEGGGVYVGGPRADATLKGCTVANNKSVSTGGGIAAKLGTVTLDDTTVENNQAVNGGGLFHLGIAVPGSLTLQNGSIIRNNTASSMGGGLFLWGNVGLKSENSEISGNKALYGAGIAASQYTANFASPKLELVDTKVNSNGDANTVMGGGLYLTSATELQVKKDSEINGNEAAYGAGICAANSTVSIEDSTVEKNTATTLGGALYVADNSNVTLTNVALLNNSAANGGALLLFNNGHATLSNVKLCGNSATNGGGAVYIWDNTSSLVANAGTEFTDNRAKNGGAIYNGGTLTLADGTTVAGNSADIGGGLYSTKNAVISTGCTFANNTATEQAADIYITGKGSTLTLTKVGDDWMLDDCGHKINGWFLDGLDARWDADGKGEHVTNLDDFKADGYAVTKNEDGSYTITILDENATLALKAAHNVIPKPTPDPDPEPTPDPDTPDTPVSPEDPTTPPVQDATPDDAETPVNPENPSNPPVQDATPDSTVAALPKTGVNWFTALAMALSGMALTVAGAFTSLFAKSKH